MNFNISVIIPVYNASEYLSKAVHSALQFSEVSEVILAEDGSTDNSLLLCKKLADKSEKVKLYRHEDFGNHGAGATRNLGLRKATCDYIAFLDADDYYLSNRFDAEKTHFKNVVDGIFGALGTEYLSEKGKAEFQEKFNGNSLTTVNYHAEGSEVFRGLLGLTAKTFGTFFHLNTLTVKREALIKYNLWFNENLRVHQDSDFIIKLAYHGHLKTGIIDKPIAIRGVHDDNRITKIKTYSLQYNQKQLLLWQSLNDWALKNKVDPVFKKRIFLQYKAFDLAVKSGIKKYFHITAETLKNPELFKTKYRFTFLNR
ncbi:capsular biosynthesis protein CpsI [Chryseobacterium sp. Leaf180]|uniref:glycosyltransferase family 2 protein n=1 Tax=Chryseobacterium sp. Leaf180 TaxID=1736289 RepID=UPI0006F5E230|nr:glycosyltransferase family 2 protein [Chryseobacterium sp. Leaf180]KQR95475.1 capsular biosynthesis protein CpsI [Chryseobacterium sp. Leaf180]